MIPQIHRLPVRSLSDLTSIPRPPMLVEEIIPEGSITLLSAPSYSGKTFFAIELARSITLGQPFMGKWPVKQGNVLLIEQDSPLYDTGRAIISVFRPYLTETEIERVGFYTVWHAGLNLKEQIAPVKIINTAKGLSTHVGFERIIEVNPEDPSDITDESRPLLLEGASLIILDTFRSIHTAEENSSTEMEAIMQIIKGIREATKAAILLIHHTTHIDPRYDTAHARGSSAIEGAVDTHFQIRKERKTGYPKVTVKKARAIQPPDFTYSITTEDSPRGEIKRVQLVSISTKLQAPPEPTPAAGPTRMEKREQFTVYLTESKESRFPRATLDTWGSLNGVTQRTISRWLADMQEEGTLTRIVEDGQAIFTSVVPKGIPV